MDKNIAAILRQDARTIGVKFDDGYGSTSKAYTYVTSVPVEVGDTVVVPSGAEDNFKLATVCRVDSDLEIEPNSSTRFKWIVSKVDFEGYASNMQRNKEIEGHLATAYRANARQAYAQQFLAGASPEVVALINGQ